MFHISCNPAEKRHFSAYAGITSTHLRNYLESQILYRNNGHLRGPEKLRLLL